MNEIKEKQELYARLKEMERLIELENKRKGGSFCLFFKKLRMFFKNLF